MAATSADSGQVILASHWWSRSHTPQYWALIGCCSQVTSQAYCGLVAGLAVATLTTIFLPVSGAHINPAVSVSAATIQVSCRQYSPLIGRTPLNTDL